MDNWQTLVGVAVTGIAALLGVSFAGLRNIISNWLSRVERNIGRDVTLNLLTTLGTVRRIVLDFHTLPYVDRVLLLASVDFEYPKNPKYACRVQAFDGWATDNRDPVQTYGTKIEVDDIYLSLLNDLLHQKRVVLSTEKMPDSILKSYYQADGIQNSIVFLLKDCGRGCIIYMSVANFRPEPFTHIESARISILVDNIRSALND